MPAKRSARSVAMLQRAMERASRELLEMRYFEAERLCRRALGRAHAAREYGLMSRIVLPLQEARRQKRQLATDPGRVGFVSSLKPDPLASGPGCYLVRPPLTGLHARSLRERADTRQIPALVLMCEPPALDGTWTVAAAGTVTVRTSVPSPGPWPEPGSAANRAIGLPPVAWVEAAAEALGDAAMRPVRSDDPAARQVDELMKALDALPDHEKLHQRLEAACRAAAGS